MAFDNNYPNRKDKRKPYYKSKVFDRSCRNHGSCDYCKSNRLHTNKKRELLAEQSLLDYEGTITMLPIEQNPVDEFIAILHVDYDDGHPLSYRGMYIVFKDEKIIFNAGNLKDDIDSVDNWVYENNNVVLMCSSDVDQFVFEMDVLITKTQQKLSPDSIYLV